MTTALTPDVEAITATYLLAHDDIEALVGDRIGGRHPHRTTTPWIKVVQIGDTVTSRSTHLVSAYLQFDCYGGRDIDTAQGEASLLARTLRAALNDMPEATHNGAVVTGVVFTGNRRVPDPDVGTPARERYILDATIYAHPA